MRHRWPIALGGATLMVLVAVLTRPTAQQHASIPHIPASLPREPEDRRGREDFELMRVRDPRTGEIPKDIRRRELRFSRTLPSAERLARDGDAAMQHAEPRSSWEQRGPGNLGGRTRALAIDVMDGEHLLAGAVSGGMWASSDGGRRWSRTTRAEDLQSVTCIVQDTRPGMTHVWYYGTGEGRGNSASGGGAPFSGDGIFRSTDNGSSWNQLPSTVSGTPQRFDQTFDYIWNIAVDASSNEDELYAATIGGISRSSDAGQTWALVLGRFASNGPRFTDVTVTPTGVVYATLSSTSIDGGTNAVQGGIWRSADGVSWTSITPGTSSWPSVSRRIVIGISPANEHEIYFLGDTPGAGFQTVYAGIAEGTSLWRYLYLAGDGTGSGAVWENRSSNLPAFGGEVGDFASQQSFNLVVAIQPDDPGTVFVGGTNLYRSTTGFATRGGTTWIGGYAGPGDLAMYPGQHADQHVLIFDREDSRKAFAGHDGGVSVTADISAPSVTWQSRSEGFVTTQFYTIAIDRTAPNDGVVVGGMQDNGTWGVFGPDPSLPWNELLSGDGAFCAVAPGRGSYYVSAQYGVTYRLLLSGGGELQGFTRVDPAGGADYLFVTPFVLDPADPNTLYMAGGQSLWRNASIGSIPLGSNEPASLGWVNLSGAAASSGVISALSASTTNPPHRIYYGTSTGQVARLDDARLASPNATATDVGSWSGFPRGAYVSCIAVDPEEGDRAILVFSNYSVPSVFLTTDGGASWSNISGNLEEFPDGSGSGPSVRWASILHRASQTVTYLGTSTGLYAAAALEGPATVWEQEGATSIGNVVVTMVESRPSDGLVLAATHGRGIFANTGAADGPGSVPVATTLLQNFPNPFNSSTSFRFRLQQQGPVTLTVFDIQGREVKTLVAEDRPAGYQPDIMWTPENLASGIYLCRLIAGGVSRTVKVAYLR